VVLSALLQGQAFAADLTLGRFRAFLDGELGPVTLAF